VETAEANVVLVHPDFLAILLAANPDRAEEIRRQMTEFVRLKEYGWTNEQILIAVETGYDYSSHFAPWSRYSWKSGANAQPMYNWLRHHYHALKGSAAGMDFEQFVAQWRRFVSRGYDTSRQKMKFFCMARRYNIGIAEAERMIIRFKPRYLSTYVELRRRGISYETLEMVMYTIEFSEERFAQMIHNKKYFIEAYRRGATSVQLRGALSDRRLREFALSLRHPNGEEL
jgi:hypothetical protein